MAGAFLDAICRGIERVALVEQLLDKRLRASAATAYGPAPGTGIFATASVSGGGDRQLFRPWSRFAGSRRGLVAPPGRTHTPLQWRCRPYGADRAGALCGPRRSAGPTEYGLHRSPRLGPPAAWGPRRARSMESRYRPGRLRTTARDAGALHTVSPRLASAVLDSEPVRVGLRPFRKDGVRVEIEKNTAIIHNWRGRGESFLGLRLGGSRPRRGVAAFHPETSGVVRLLTCAALPCMPTCQPTPRATFNNRIELDRKSLGAGLDMEFTPRFSLILTTQWRSP